TPEPGCQPGRAGTRRRSRSHSIGCSACSARSRNHAMLNGSILGLTLCLVAAYETTAAVTIWEEPGGGIVFALAPDPARPGTVYAGAARGGIFESTDAARTWRRLARAPHPTRIKALAVGGGRRIYATDGKSGIFQSRDSGASWNAVAPAAGAED